MYVSWRRQQLLDDYRDAAKPCACENNGDLCNPCAAREAIGMSKTPVAARAAVAYQKEAIAKYEGLRNAGMDETPSDVAILADDLSTVRFEVAIDGPYKGAYSTARLFLSRIGGIGALPRYMPCIRSKQ